MATQELQQIVCHQFGWSARYFRNDVGCWAVEVIQGLGAREIFVSTDQSMDSIKGRKQGKRAAALVALEGLKPAIERELNKPVVHGLDEAVQQLFAGTRISEASPNIWREFWRNTHDAVGIDVEGNLLTPPVLVQIATNDTVILEMPSDAGISTDLQRLLNDESIIKVLCDSPSGKDAKSLGLTAAMNSKPKRKDLVNLEQVAASRMGPVGVARGLSKLACLTIPELSGVQISKESGTQRLKDVGTFTAIEQGFRPRLHGFRDLTPEERRYAAVDAWCTLQIWRHLTGTTDK